MPPMQVPSTSDLAAQRLDAATRDFAQKRSDMAEQRQPPVSYGTAITQRNMGATGPSVDPVAVSDKVRSPGEPKHLVDILA